jgi:heme exporter protein CcmD
MEFATSHLTFVLTSYMAVGLLIIGLAGWIWIDQRQSRMNLAKLDERARQEVIPNG